MPNPIRQDDCEQLFLLTMCDKHTDIMHIIVSDEVKALVYDILPESLRDLHTDVLWMMNLLGSFA